MTKEKLISIKEAAKSALHCQDACNLSGVVFAFEKAMRKICDVSHTKDKGTNWRNHHPICILFAYKIASLTGQEPIESPMMFEEALQECKKLAKD